MKCELCHRRKAKHKTFLDWLGKAIMLCEKCRKAEVPTVEEQRQDDEREMHRSERQSEIDAAHAEVSYIDY